MQAWAVTPKTPSCILPLEKGGEVYSPYQGKDGRGGTALTIEIVSVQSLDPHLRNNTATPATAIDAPMMARQVSFSL